MKHFGTTLKPQAQQILNASAAMELQGVSPQEARNSNLIKKANNLKLEGK
jgi:hypothetical protein